MAQPSCQKRKVNRERGIRRGDGMHTRRRTLNGPVRYSPCGDGIKWFSIPDTMISPLRGCFLFTWLKDGEDFSASRGNPHCVFILAD